MAEQPAIEQLQTKLDELLEAAKSGRIIPIRLSGQIEELIGLVGQTRKEQDKAIQEAKATVDIPADMAEYMKEEAYFVGHAIHELRNPMTSIRGYSDMLGAMGELSDMQKTFLNTVKTNVRRMESLMTDLSTVNKIRKGTLKLSPKMDMFKNIAMRLEKDFAPVITELNRQLVFDIPQGLPILNIDSDLLVQAMSKLIENSLRYSPAETGKVTISGAEDNGKLVIKIVDNGIGISETDMAQLGKMYFRGDHDVVREYKGSGLGIPVAYGLIEKLGGTIKIDSTPDVGTTVTITVAGN
jgi:signal transduction histidine kinase